MLTLKDFSEKVLRPMLTTKIKSGSLDCTFSDPDCLEIMLNDPELKKAFMERLADIENQHTKKPR